MKRLVSEQAEPDLFNQIAAMLDRAGEATIKVTINGVTYLVKEETVYTRSFYFLLHELHERL